MDINLDQLPIPDWDLTCPECHYPLRGLPEHRCPECGREFKVRDLVHHWTRLRDPAIRGDELPIPAMGIQCPKCKEVLDGSPSHVCPKCGRDVGEQFEPIDREDAKWGTVEVGLCNTLSAEQIAILFQQELVPYTISDEEGVAELYGAPRMKSIIRVPTDFSHEVRWLLCRENQRLEAEKTEGGEPRRCSHCGETSPWNFDSCWNCGEAFDNE